MMTTRFNAKRDFRTPLMAAGACLLFGVALAPAPASAATNLVRMVNYAFQPKFLTNNVGDTVLWTNITTTAHNTVSSNGVWRSSLFLRPGTFPFKFTTPGVYGYYCEPHVRLGMVGIIYVQGAANTPPTVAITNPPVGATFTAPAAFTLQATASDSDGSVTNVEFFQGTVLLGAVTSPPFQVAVSNLAAGIYDFTARAVDNMGTMSTPAVAPVTVADLRFGPPAPFTGGEFPLTLLLTPNLSYAVEASTDLNAWDTVTNFAAASDTVTVPVPVNGDKQRFFRARVLPKQ